MLTEIVETSKISDIELQAIISKQRANISLRLESKLFHSRDAFFFKDNNKKLFSYYYLYRYFQTLDKTSHIIYHHYIVGYDISVVSSVTSLKESQINRILGNIFRDAERFLDDLDLASNREEFVRFTRLFGAITKFTTDTDEDCEYISDLLSVEYGVAKIMKQLVLYDASNKIAL